MINDQALLHLLARQEHTIVTLEDALKKAADRIRELEAAGGGAEDDTGRSPE